MCLCKCIAQFHSKHSLFVTYNGHTYSKEHELFFKTRIQAVKIIIRDTKIVWEIEFILFDLVVLM